MITTARGPDAVNAISEAPG